AAAFRDPRPHLGRPAAAGAELLEERALEVDVEAVVAGRVDVGDVHRQHPVAEVGRLHEPGQHIRQGEGSVHTECIDGRGGDLETVRAGGRKTQARAGRHSVRVITTDITGRATSRYDHDWPTPTSRRRASGS